MATNHWLGTAADYDCENPANWSLGHIPTGTEDVTLGGTGDTALEIDTGKTVTCRSFTQTGFGLQLDGGTLAVGVGGMLLNGGTLSDASGTPHVTVAGNFVMNSGYGSGTFSAAVPVSFHVVGSATAHGIALDHMDFSGGTALDASDGCTDGGGNTNVNFAAPAPSYDSTRCAGFFL